MTDSPRQMTAWDNEYFDYLDAQIDAQLEAQWNETQDEQRASLCRFERDGWICGRLIHDDQRHVFVNTGVSLNGVILHD